MIWLTWRQLRVQAAAVFALVAFVVGCGRYAQAAAGSF